MHLGNKECIQLINACLRTHTHLTRYKFKLCLLVDFLQGAGQHLVLHVGEINPGENVSDQSVKPGAISEGQLGHGVQSQRLHHQTALLNYTGSTQRFILMSLQLEMRREERSNREAKI